MRSYAARRRVDLRTLLLLAPGWVTTDLGSPNADLTIGWPILTTPDLHSTLFE